MWHAPSWFRYRHSFLVLLAFITCVKGRQDQCSCNVHCRILEIPLPEILYAHHICSRCIILAYPPREPSHTPLHSPVVLHSFLVLHSFPVLTCVHSFYVHQFCVDWHLFLVLTCVHSSQKSTQTPSWLWLSLLVLTCVHSPFCIHPTQTPSWLWLWPPTSTRWVAACCSGVSQSYVLAHTHTHTHTHTHWRYVTELRVSWSSVTELRVSWSSVTELRVSWSSVKELRVSWSSVTELRVSWRFFNCTPSDKCALFAHPQFYFVCNARCTGHRNKMFPLHVHSSSLCVLCSLEQVVKALLKYGVDVNEMTSTRETALVRCLASVTNETAQMDASILKWVRPECVCICVLSDMSAMYTCIHPAIHPLWHNWGCWCSCICIPA